MDHPVVILMHNRPPTSFLAARRRHDLHQLLPAVPRDAPRQAALEGRGHPHAALDLHQVLPGAPLGLHPHRTHLLHLRGRRHAGEGTECLNLDRLRT